MYHRCRPFSYLIHFRCSFWHCRWHTNWLGPGTLAPKDIHGTVFSPLCASLSTCYVWATSLCQIMVFAFYRVRLGYSWRLSERAWSRMSITRQSRIISEVSCPYEHRYSSVIYWPPYSFIYWSLLFKRAHLKMKLCHTWKYASSFSTIF